MTISSDTIPILYEEDSTGPGLPHIVVSLLIGQDQEFDSISYTMSVGDTLQNIYMAPNPIGELTNMACMNNHPRLVSYPPATYPNENVRYFKTYSIGGLKMLAISVCPFKYNSSTHELVFISNMTLNIVLNQDPSPLFSNGDVSFDESMLEAVQHSVINPEDMSSLYSTYPPLAGYQVYNSNNYNYYIITSDSLAPYFQPLADWKTLKGIRTRVVTTTEIYNSINENIRPQLKIKRWLQAHGGSKLNYLLLGGDETVVPSQPCHEQIDYMDASGEIQTLETYSLPADMFYACYSGSFDWDANGNGYCGEVDDNINYDMRFCVARAPVQTANDVRVFVSKILSYESGKSMVHWKKNIFMGGRVLGRNLETGICDAHNKSNLIYENNIVPYWDGERTFLFGTGHNIEGKDEHYYFTGANLQEQLSKGFNFIDIITHGAPYCWVASWGNYTTDLASSLQMPTPAIVTTTACSTNMFDSQEYDPCLSEAFIRNPNCGVLAYIGSSREGVSSSDGDVHIGHSEYLISQFYDCLMRHWANSLGKVFNYAKIQNGTTPDFLDIPKWVTMATNLMGDPEMPIFLEEPKRFNAPVVKIENGILTIRGIERTNLAIISANDFGESFFGVANRVDSLKCWNYPDTCFISLTRNGYIPMTIYIADGKVWYLQNEVLSGQQEIVVDEIHIGKDIVPYKEVGPVVVSDGSTEIVSKHGVTIHNGFEVQQGAVFSIETRN